MGRVESMGHQQRRRPTHQLAQNIQQLSLRRRIQRAGGFVQQQNRGIPQKSPGNSNPLPLAPTQHDPSLPHLRLVPVGQCQDKFMRLRFLRRDFNLSKRSPQSPIRDILLHGSA